jgi:RhtB (resistance to homoserine/threonine) family protein
MCAIHLVAMISPGPDFLLVVKNSMKYSSRMGSYTALGVALGLVIHMTYCILGLGLVISQSILLFNIIKYLGAAYLICIGIASFLSKDEPLQIDAKKDVHMIPPMQAVKMGFLVNALNPKATLAFVSIFSAFITPETPLRISLAFAVFVILSALVWFSFVASIFTFQKVRYIFEKAKTRVDRTIGILFVSLGLKIVDV